MRKIIGAVLALVGAFLVVLGILAQFYAPDRLMKTPIDVDNVTDLEGTAQLSDGTELQSYPVKAWSVTKADSERSTDDVVLFVSSSCLVKDEGGISECVSDTDPQKRLITASTENIALDRRTALVVNDPDILPADAGPASGLVKKFPFEAEQTTYPFWDGMVGSSVDAVFDRTEDLDGLETYVYRIVVEDAPAEVTDGVNGTYSTDKELFVDPLTGSIVNQIEHQERFDAEGDPLLVLDLEFTADEVASSVEDAKANGDRLGLIRTTLPLIGWFAGVPLLIVGVVLMVLGYRTTGRRAA